MSILFKNAQIIDPEAGTVITGDLMIADGQIVAPSPNAKMVIDCTGKFLAPGIIDIGVKVAEPGERHKESIAPQGRPLPLGA